MEDLQIPSQNLLFIVTGKKVLSQSSLQGDLRWLLSASHVGTYLVCRMLTGIGRPGRDKITTWSFLRSLPKISRAHSIQSGQGSSALPLPSLLHRAGPLKILPGQGFQSAVGYCYKGQGSSPFLHAAEGVLIADVWAKLTISPGNRARNWE